ncbi:short-chain dehydrogenase [Polyplosphaeria fusca]|uniref:Short-chain dehydrogenase n=1 Tax=Polyplosphaeria fusca TaxID=682080 RepID=A0A9P4R782_9PLEO|nr:short-chain dehydrogenase [Polyplosphaeria fusca]
MGGMFSRMWDQSFFLPKPTFTEDELPDQTGKVHIITGGYTGIGFELAKMLYSRNSTVYLAGRSPSKGSAAINTLNTEFPDSKGRVEFLHLDLADLSTIKASATSFLAKETRLDVLINNAGVMIPPKDSKTAQGYDLQTGTNVYGPFLFTTLLLPILQRTAQTAEKGSVRVCWASSIGGEVFAPKGGVAFGSDGLLDSAMSNEKLYGQSKAASILLGAEAAYRWGKDGIISNSFHPGNLQSELQRHASAVQRALFGFMLHPVKFGAYTELFAGWSPEVTGERNGGQSETGPVLDLYLIGQKNAQESRLILGEAHWNRSTSASAFPAL